MSEATNYSWFYPETILDNRSMESAEAQPARRKKKQISLLTIPGARPRSRKQMRRHCQMR